MGGCLGVARGSSAIAPPPFTATAFVPPSYLSSPPTLLGREVQEGGREEVAVGENARKKQETLSCYIITTPGIMCTLIKIHVCSPPPTLTDHREKGRLVGLLAITRQIETWVGRTGGERGVHGGRGCAVMGWWRADSTDGWADGKRREEGALGNRWPARSVMVLVISGDLGCCLAGWISAVPH